MRQELRNLQSDCRVCQCLGRVRQQSTLADRWGYTVSEACLGYIIRAHLKTNEQLVYWHEARGWRTDKQGETSWESATEFIGISL